jgi:hypothetical protein
MANLFPCGALELDPNQILARLQAIGQEAPSARDAHTKSFFDSFSKIFRETYTVKPSMKIRSFSSFMLSVSFFWNFLLRSCADPMSIRTHA